ncbi:dihydroxyacetone kinase subunit DhaK [Telmatospirillum sp.]|uniref:dihydroxyacetone kinase subunit DhaK n=1 Tax=Telmatospirillum sp. TaxID=2079197 RepID=UPI00283CE901|nr:dihydroxyacetone kinase subunit DhaK [Telmatospirillum sp.]MDR3438269.1 dihydroxyacetone kinase subunit DhaK [Telmatospirillum sp.]
MPSRPRPLAWGREGPHWNGDGSGMGGTPLIELYIIYRKAAAIAQKHGLKIVRSLVGSYIISLEMAGTSITVLRANDELVGYWDAPVKTPALCWGD